MHEDKAVCFCTLVFAIIHAVISDLHLFADLGDDVASVSSSHDSSRGDSLTCLCECQIRG